MNIQTQTITRRSFLRGVGGAMVALPHLNVMAETPNVPKIPKRIAAIGTYFGFVPTHFFPKETGSSYELPRLLKPLQGMRDKFTVFSNLDHGSEATGGHEGVHSFLSGVRSQNSSGLAERNVTMDQKAGAFVGSETRYPSMQFTSGSHSSNLLSWNTAGVAVPPIRDLRALHALLFQEPRSKDISVLRRVFEENRSVLDLVNEDAKFLDRRVGKEDKDKLDQYFSSIREMEKKLTQSAQWLDRPKPKVSYSVPTDANEMSFRDRIPLYYDLMALALHTDSTRVITLEISDLGRNSGGFGLTKGYHQLTHHGKLESYIKELLVVEDFHMEQYARFLNKLSEMKEADGSPLLNHTMALMGSGIGNASSHSNRNLPLVLAGGGFKHGQHIRCNSGGTSQITSNLYVSMLQQFGMEVDKFNLATGTLSGLDVA